MHLARATGSFGRRGISGESPSGQDELGRPIESGHTSGRAQGEPGPLQDQGLKIGKLRTSLRPVLDWRCSTIGIGNLSHRFMATPLGTDGFRQGIS